MRHILIIDNESDVREAMQRALSGPDMLVATAADAEQGLAHLRTAATDLIICEIMLPGLDGPAAIAEITRQYPDIGIIAMTGGGLGGVDRYRPDAIVTRAYLEAARHAGAHAVLAKPFAIRQLRALIRQVLDCVPAQVA